MNHKLHFTRRELALAAGAGLLTSPLGLHAATPKDTLVLALAFDDIISHFAPEFEKLLLLALMLPWGAPETI